MGNVLLDKGLQTVTELAANSIEGGQESAADTAQMRLNQARKDISQIIRSGNKRDISTDESDDEYEHVIKKYKKRRMTKAKEKTKRKKINLLKELKNGK